MRLKSIFLKLILILVIGGLGGILFDRALFPYLSRFSPFDKIGWIAEQKNITQIINRTEQVVIKENEALEQAVQKVSLTVGAILQKDRKGIILDQFSGFILTGDGLILTCGDFSKKSKLYFLTKERELPLELVKEDTKLNLTIFKARDSNFSTAPLGDFDKLKLGERVFLVGAKMGDDQKFQNFVNQGVLKSINENFLTINILEEKFATGSPLFNIKGEMIGMNIVEKDGEIKVVPINKIREFVK